MSDRRWANKYRPRTLDQVVGQDAAIAIIKGALQRKSLGNTILLSGHSGNGKTTIARIIAANLSGYQGDDLEKNPDLLESNVGAERSIADIRDLIKLSKYSPVGGKHRIILMDEAHALLGPSLNALLKELEEPSPRTTWILCTDQPHKLPATVHGRAQSIRLGDVTPKDLAPYLYKVLKREKVNLKNKEKSVAIAIAKAVYGQPRLGLQLLEDTVNAYTGGLSLEKSIQSALQSTPSAAAFEAANHFVMALLAKDGAKAAKAIASAESADGILIIANQMLEGIIRRKLNFLPNNGVSWATKNVPVAQLKLEDVLVLQKRFVAAVDMAGRYTVAPASILYTLASV